MPNAKRKTLKLSWAALVLASFTLLPLSVSAATDEPVIPAAAQLQNWYANGHGGRYLLQLLPGQSAIATANMSGVVLSDSNCQADANGLSHCHNQVELSNGRRITVVNTHLMRVNRCLAAGDRLSLQGLGADWVVGQLDRH